MRIPSTLDLHRQRIAPRGQSAGWLSGLALWPEPGVMVGRLVGKVWEALAGATLW